MDRDEILAKSRASGQDEMELQIKDRAFRWVYLTMVLAAAAFAWVRGMQGQPIMDLCATVSLSVAVGNLYRGTRLKDRFTLITGLVMLAAAVFAAVRFFLGH